MAMHQHPAFAVPKCVFSRLRWRTERESRGSALFSRHFRVGLNLFRACGEEEKDEDEKGERSNNCRLNWQMGVMFCMHPRYHKTTWGVVQFSSPVVTLLAPGVTCPLHLSSAEMKTLSRPHRIPPQLTANKRERGFSLCVAIYE